MIRDPSKDKELELEFGWLTSETNHTFSHVPKELVLEADRTAQSSLSTTQEVIGATEEKSMEVVDI